MKTSIIWIVIAVIIVIVAIVVYLKSKNKPIEEDLVDEKPVREIAENLLTLDLNEDLKDAASRGVVISTQQQEKPIIVGQNVKSINNRDTTSNLLRLAKEKNAYQNYIKAIAYKNLEAKSKNLKVVYTPVPLREFANSQEYKSGQYDNAFIAPKVETVKLSQAQILVNENKAKQLLADYKALLVRRPLFSGSKVNFDENSIRANTIEKKINELGWRIQKFKLFGRDNYKLIK